MEITIAKVREPTKALQKPHLRVKPGTKAAAKAKIIAFSTKKNNPKLRIIIGNVKMLRIGSKIAFKMPKTAAAIAALPKLSISIPNGNLEMIKKLTVVTNQVRIISPMIDTSFSIFF
jgi:hypothetical protein